MSATLSLTDAAIMTGLRSFLLGILPAGVGVYRGQDNRVAEPSEPDYVLMVPFLRERLGTNVVSYNDQVVTEIAPSNRSALQPTKVTVQLDVHGPNSTDNAQIVVTLLRDDYACQALAATTPGVQPLYAGDPRQMPFVNGEGQYEDRWTIDAVFQANAAVATPQDFAATVRVTMNDVDALYPID